MHAKVGILLYRLKLIILYAAMLTGAQSNISENRQYFKGDK